MLRGEIPSVFHLPSISSPNKAMRHPWDPPHHSWADPTTPTPHPSCYLMKCSNSINVTVAPEMHFKESFGNMFCSRSLSSQGITFPRGAGGAAPWHAAICRLGGTMGKGERKCKLFSIFFNNVSPSDTPLFVTITFLTQALNWILFSNL